MADKISHISQSKLAISTINDYQFKTCRKFSDSCWNLLFDADKSMLLCFISAQNPPEVEIITKNPTKEGLCST